ncbi:MAG: twin-arginine translocase subunit TatC [Nitrospirae bacterium]|nr:twin-arginine translocase subunit TatC [Nitrospirota bacterium]
MDTDNTNEPASDKKMSLVEHLSELRTCLIISVIAIAVGFVASFYFSEGLLKALTDLISSDQKHVFVFLSPAEALWANFKIALIAGFLVALPVILYQLWKFISPGFYKTERKYALLFIAAGVISFALGVIFCYFVILRYALDFLMTYKTANLTPMISIGSYMDFVVKFMLAFGLIFELPIAIIFLTKMGILTISFLTRNRKYAILINFVVAAVLTPTPDVFNQLMMAGPLIALYELGIIGARIFCRDAKTRKDLSVNQLFF